VNRNRRACYNAIVRDDELAAVQTRWLADARAAWPDIATDERAFLDRQLARLSTDVTAEQALVLHASDLWIASACATGDRIALAHFEEQFVAPLTRVLNAVGLAGDQIDEVKQELRRKLLVSEGEPPRILDYSGRADLRTWLRTTATRLAIDLLRRRGALPIDDDELAQAPALNDDPEIAHLKERYRGELAAAISEAVAKLAPRDRLLLKYHYVDGLTIDRIGAIYAIHRATAARWLGTAREALADATHAVLGARLGVTGSELRSIARLVESQLDLSIRRLLA
jgi:RNA polymerase sigma-70 factor (ECF subfamily)